MGVGATLAFLALAAALEIGGDAAIRYGLIRSSWVALVGGGVLLVAYGFTVNANRSVDFGRLFGLYIAVLFVVVQLIGVAVFGERPGVSVLAGGALIVAGGAVVLMGMR